MMKYIGVSDFMTSVTLLLLVAFVILLVLSVTIVYIFSRIHKIENELMFLYNYIIRMEDNK